MITLIGHGYVGDHIKQELDKQGVKYTWITHNDAIPKDTTVIINAAGYTGSPNVDACEKERQQTIDGNVIFPLELEHSVGDIPVVHISSGCVYTGYKNGDWTEYDEPNFDFNNGSFYSGTKTLAQRLLIPFLNKSYLLRIRMPFGDYDHPKNLLSKLMKYNKLINFENSLSYVNDVASVAVHFATTLPTPGIYNVCNPGSKTTKQIADMMGLTKQWFTEQEFNEFVTAPRSNCVLSTAKLDQIYPLKSADETLSLAISKMNSKLLV